MERENEAREKHDGEGSAQTASAFDERIAPGGAPAASEKRARGALGRRQKAVAAAVALLSVAVIGASAWALAQPAAPSAPAPVAAAAGQDGPEPGDAAPAPDAQDAPDPAPQAADDPAPASDAPAPDSPSGDGGSSAPAGGSGSSAAPSGGEPSAGQSAPPQQPARDTVTVSVTVSSSDVGGGVSASTTVEFEPGATAYDALCATGLSVNASASPLGIYVHAVGGLAEFEHGGESGWKYYVNGEELSYSCGNCVLNDGDVVLWAYRLDA